MPTALTQYRRYTMTKSIADLESLEYNIKAERSKQHTSAIDKLMAAGCAGAQGRDGLSSFFAAIFAKMARLVVCGRCMCRFRFHETESALYVRVMSLTLMFVCHAWLDPYRTPLQYLSYRVQLECCNLDL